MGRQPTGLRAIAAQQLAYPEAGYAAKRRSVFEEIASRRWNSTFGCFVAEPGPSRRYSLYP